MQFVIGRIVRPHGIRGEVLVEVTTDEPALRFTAGSVLVTDSAATLTIDSVRPHQGRLLITFGGVDDRDAAERLRGVQLRVDAADVELPDDPDEFHDSQLIGLAAVDGAGERLGEIVRIQHGPGSELLVLRRESGKEALVPFVKAMVPEVDLAGGRIVLTLPEGLLDL